jgi:hypothetical protein
VEHLAPTIAIGRVHTVEEDGVKMRVEPEVAVGALDDRHGAELAGGQTAVDVSPSVPGRHRVREDAHHLTEQLSVEREREAQGEGNCEHELSQRYVGQHVIHEVQRSLIHPPAETTGAHRASLARKRHSMMLATGFTEKVGETSAQDSARHERVQFLRHELRQRAPAGGVGPLLLEGQQVLLQHLIKGSLVRLPARVDRAGRRRLYACRCRHREGLSASGSPMVRAARDLQLDR